MILHFGWNFFYAKHYRFRCGFRWENLDRFQCQILFISVLISLCSCSIVWLHYSHERRKTFKWSYRYVVTAMVWAKPQSWGNWLRSPTNIKGANKDFKIYVGRSASVHNLLFLCTIRSHGTMHELPKHFYWLVPQYGVNQLFCARSRRKKQTKT